MKRIVILVFVIAVSFLMTACLPSASRIVEDIEDRLTTQEQETDQTEESENQTNQETTESENRSDETTKDSETEGSGMSWPADKLPSDMPPLTDVQIAYVSEIAGQMMIGFENCDQATIKSYIDSLQKLGWSSVMSVEGTEGLANTLQRDENTIQITWSDDQQGAIVYLQKN